MRQFFINQIRAEGAKCEKLRKPYSRPVASGGFAGGTQIFGKGLTNMNKSKNAIFASGCFWGTQHYLGQAPGVIKSRVGYTGGNVPNPSYEQVSKGDTGHVEAVEVAYDPALTDYEALAKLFFETHDPTQANGQGPDIGSQYRSVIFYGNDKEKEIAEKLIRILQDKGMKIATKLEKASQFFTAEDYHQDYYAKSGGSPYCHIYRKLS